MENVTQKIQRKTREVVLATGVGQSLYKATNPGRPSFACPVCGYEGPFLDVKGAVGGPRQHVLCPNCNSAERHRFQYLVFQTLFEKYDFSQLSMLHFAPEPFLVEVLKPRLKNHETADISMPGVDHYEDMTQLSFADGSYDIVFASHVLEHIRDDEKALSELRRILRPGGFAILPVPIVSNNTIEYPAPNPHEWDHVRAPGVDYFNKYARYFDRMDVYQSSQFPESAQVYIYEDRTLVPNEKLPHREPMQGERHQDYVPVMFR